jgi:hypothetical protein
MSHAPDRYEAIFNSMSPEEIEEANRKNDEEHIRQVTAFREAYARNHCYLCDSPFDQMRSDEPCIHWLLRRCKFKKGDFPKVYERYGYYNIAAFLRWCANEEALLRNINDLEEEQSERKIISATIKWKNIEWTFDCTLNDLQGHGKAHSAFPHYHFQMRIDGRQFINFNDFHVPFNDHDLFGLSLRDKAWFRQGFGAAGSGMQEAVSVDLNALIEHTTPSESEEDAPYHFSTIIDASDNPLSGEELHSIIEEARRTNKSFAFVAQSRLKDRAKVQTVVSPSDAVPEIAARTEHKPR